MTEQRIIYADTEGSFSIALKTVASLLDRMPATPDRLPNERISEREWLNGLADRCRQLAALTTEAEAIWGLIWQSDSATVGEVRERIGNLISALAAGFTVPHPPVPPR